jgi:hypothetical protein
MFLPLVGRNSGGLNSGSILRSGIKSSDYKSNNYYTFQVGIRALIDWTKDSLSNKLIE